MSFIGQFLRVTLTEAEVVGLVARMKNGDFEARNKLVSSQYQRIAKAATEIAEQYDRFGMKEDLFQVGCIALVEGLRTFKFEPPTRGTFLNFALIVAKNGMRRYMEYEAYRETEDYPQPILDDGDDAEEYAASAIEAAPDLSPRVLDVIMAQEEREAMLGALTDHQRQVVGLLEEGYTQEEIGERLGISQQTVGEYIEAIQKKVSESVTF